MPMDADDLRERLHNLETLVTKLLDKEAHIRHSDRVIGSMKNFEDDEGIQFRTHCENGGPAESGNGNDSSVHRGQSGSWEMTMFSLAKELETICSRGSSPRDSPTISPCLTPTNGIAVPSRRTPSTGSNGGGGRISHQGSLCETVGEFAPPADAKQVRVRHEETEDRLDRSLTIICRHNSPQTSSRSAMTSYYENETERKYVMARNAKLKYRDSAKYGVRFRLDLKDRDPDHVTVAVDTENHILRVYWMGEMIHLLQLAEDTDPQTLSCTIVDGATLFIKQRSKETMCLEQEGGSEISLPIVHQDESNLTTTIALRLPPARRSIDDVSVKTIDDTIVIRTGSTSGEGGAEGANNTHKDHHGGTDAGHGLKFCVAMNLPEGTESRSVCAWVTKGQLTVKGQLIPASRRMTCAF